jgi:phage terminase small subunit
MAPKKPTPSKSERTKHAKRYAPSGLTWGRERFCLEYVKDHNGARSARDAGYNKSGARAIAHELLTFHDVRGRISELEGEIAQKLRIEHHDVLKRLWETATGDVNDIVRVERRCCRHCYGEQHEYQWRTEREYKRAVDQFLKHESGGDVHVMIELGEKIDAGGRIPNMPENAGGYGFDARLEPHPDCPECNGEGVETVQISDTRGAVSHPLYDGVKQTKEGIEIKIADRAKALEHVARHLKFFNDSVDLNVSEELLQAARNINAASPPLDPKYAQANRHRLFPEDHEDGD